MTEWLLFSLYCVFFWSHFKKNLYFSSIERNKILEIFHIILITDLFLIERFTIFMGFTRKPFSWYLKTHVSWLYANAILCRRIFLCGISIFLHNWRIIFAVISYNYAYHLSLPFPVSDLRVIVFLIYECVSSWIANHYLKILSLLEISGI